MSSHSTHHHQTSSPSSPSSSSPLDFVQTLPVKVPIRPASPTSFYSVSPTSSFEDPVNPLLSCSLPGNDPFSLNSCAQYQQQQQQQQSRPVPTRRSLSFSLNSNNTDIRNRSIIKDQESNSGLKEN